VLGLLVAAFGRSKVAAGLACLLTPWVDERFVLTLPLVVVVRCIASRGIKGEPSGRFLSEGVRVFSLVAPYCAMRLVAVAIAHDGHIRTQLTLMPSASQVADGLRSGLRGLWLFVALAPALPGKAVARPSSESEPIGATCASAGGPVYSARGEVIHFFRVGIAHRREPPRPKTVGDAHPKMAHSAPCRV
jgi:hypothetical protein